MGVGVYFHGLAANTGCQVHTGYYPGMKQEQLTCCRSLSLQPPDNPPVPHLQVIQQRLQSPVGDAGAPQPQRVHVLGGQRERVDHVEDVLVGGAAQTEAVEAPPEEGGVEAGALHPLAAPQLAALQHRHQALPVPGGAVEDVAPPGAHLGKKMGGEGDVWCWWWWPPPR